MLLDAEWAQSRPAASKLLDKIQKQKDKTQKQMKNIAACPEARAARLWFTWL